MNPPSLLPLLDDECQAGATVPLLDHDTAEAQAALLKALADPIRLQLLQHISGSPGTTVCACHLPAALGISQPTLSHHLKKLSEAGLVKRERRGRWLHYTLAEDTLDLARAALERIAALASP